MNPWILLAGATVAVVALARREPQRVAGAPLLVFDATMTGPEQKTRDVVVPCSSGRPAKPWRCGKGKQIPIPLPSQVLPASVVAAGGPIVQTIEQGIKIVKQIFAALGWAKRCTVASGEMVVVDVVQNDGPAPRWWLQVECGYENTPAQIAWTFDETANDTIELPMQSETVVGDAREEEVRHMLDGREPPAPWHFPHGNMLKWRAFGGDGAGSLARRPLAFVQRSPAGQALSLLVWLPPRAPATHLNAFGKQVIDHCVLWRLTWKVIR
jgi:hypothetical protein